MASLEAALTCGQCANTACNANAPARSSVVWVAKACFGKGAVAFDGGTRRSVQNRDESKNREAESLYMEVIVPHIPY